MLSNEPIAPAVAAARTGDLLACRALVDATREMAYAVAWQMLRREQDAPRRRHLLDAEERTWTHEQQRTLGRALILLSQDERRLCERPYHGGWSAERLAKDA